MKEKIKEKATHHEEEDGAETQETEEERGEEEQEEKEEEYEEMMETEAQRPWEETAQQKYFGYQDASQRTTPPKVEDIETARARIMAGRRDNTSPKETESQRRLRERFEKAQSVRDQLDKLQRPQTVTDDDSEKDSGVERISKAA